MASTSHLLFTSPLIDLKPQEGSLRPTEQPAAFHSKGMRKFPKSARLLTSSHYRHLKRNSLRHFGESISIDFREGEGPSAKLGITVSKKFGKAHDRNLFKRVVREAFRELCLFLPQNLELNISPRNRTTPITKQAVLLDLKTFLSSIL
jgi:ribonuclease P protein component